MTSIHRYLLTLWCQVQGSDTVYNVTLMYFLSALFSTHIIAQISHSWANTHTGYILLLLHSTAPALSCVIEKPLRTRILGEPIHYPTGGKAVLYAANSPSSGAYLVLFISHSKQCCIKHPQAKIVSEHLSSL